MEADKLYCGTILTCNSVSLNSIVLFPLPPFAPAKPANGYNYCEVFKVLISLIFFFKYKLKGMCRDCDTFEGSARVGRK